ncbi:MAG: thiamine diphosphokinase [Microthrixaceae bacterium]
MSNQLTGRAVVFSGGPLPFTTRSSESAPASFTSDFENAVVACTSQSQLVVAADSGLHLALFCGQTPNLVIGDMDSVDPVALDQAMLDGAEVRSFPADKDATDLELALEAVLSSVDFQIGIVTVIGSGEGRIDHLFAGLLLLASEKFASLRIDAWLGNTYVAIVRDSWSIAAQPGQLITVLALNGTASGVSCSGLRWALDGNELQSGSTRGISNEFIDPVASISVESGVVAVILNPNGAS